MAGGAAVPGAPAAGGAAPLQRRAPLRAQLRHLGGQLELALAAGQAGAHALRGLRAGGCRRGRRHGLERRVARAPPPHAGPVHVLERLRDAVPLAEVVDRAAALRERAVVVDDHVAAGREPAVERGERHPRRLVGVAIHADERPAFARERGQRLLEVARARSGRRRRGRSGRSSPGPPPGARRGSRRRRDGPARRRRRSPGRSRPRRRCGRRRARRASRASGSRRRRATRPASIRSPGTSSRTTDSTQRWRSSRRLRPTIVSPCIGQSMPAARTRSCSPPSSREVTVPSSHLPTDTVVVAVRSQSASLSRPEVGVAQRRGLRARARARVRDGPRDGPGIRSGPTDPARSSPRDDIHHADASRSTRAAGGDRGARRREDVPGSRAPRRLAQGARRAPVPPDELPRAARAARRVLRRPPGRVLRHRRPQRLRQEHAAEDHGEHLPRRPRPDPHGRAARAVHRARRRLQHGDDVARERRPERRDDGPGAARGAAAARLGARLRRSSASSPT